MGRDCDLLLPYNAFMMAQKEWFAQEKYALRLDWGWEGARRAAERGDLLVVVDILRFSTAMTVAASRNITVTPTFWSEDIATQEAKKYLSPALMQTVPEGTHLTVPSPNGATCCRYGKDAAGVYIGSFLNVQAIARAVDAKLKATEAKSVTILACGERWHEGSNGDDGALRFALEDYLGAGAIIAHLPGYASSPECKAARAAFVGARKQLFARLSECGSGVELTEKWYEDDIRIAAHLNSLDVVPVLKDGVIGPLTAL
jgi:2-phosphosulfolactate phosphatase